MGEAYALAAISAACRFLPLALLLPVPLGAARWSVRLSVGLLLVFLGSVYMAPELQGAHFAPSTLLLDCAYGFTLAVALSMVLPVGTLFGAILDAHVPEWRSERPFGRLVELLVVVLILGTGLELDAIERLLGSLSMLPSSTPEGLLDSLTNAILRGSALFAIALGLALPIVVAVALVETALAIGVKLSAWPSAAPMGLRPLLVLLFVLSASLSVGLSVLDWLQQALG